MMDDRLQFFHSMWKLVIIMLTVVFAVTGAVVVLAIFARLLGQEGALRTDFFQFCLIIFGCCIPFYVFLRLIRMFVLFGFSKLHGEQEP